MQIQWDYFVNYYFLYSLGGLAILLSVIHMLYRRRSPLSMTAWLLLMIIAPYFFVLFYFFFGIRKRSLHKEKSPLVIYSQDDEGICIEPVTAPPDAQNLGIKGETYIECLITFNEDF